MKNFNKPLYSIEYKTFDVNLNSNGKWLSTVLLGSCSDEAIEPALQERHQPGVPISEDEKDEEGNGEVILDGDGVPDRQCKISANRQFNVGHESETLAVFFRRYGFVLLADNAILRSASERGLLADQGLQNSLRVGNGEADTQRHQRRKVEERPQPGAWEQFLLRDQVEAR